MRFGIAVAFLCLLAPAAQAETISVAVPHKGNWDTSIVDFGVRAGIFKKEGLTIKTVYTQGGATTVQSVLSGSIDVGIQTGLFGLIGAYVKGAPVRVISAAATGAADQFWYSKAGSGIKTLKDANGKTVSYSEVGSSSNLTALSLVKLYGVNAKLVRTGGLPSTFTQVMSGQVDVGWSAAPFGLEAAKEGKIQIVARGSEVKDLKDETTRVNFVSAATLAKKRAALIKFSKGYIESLKWMYSHPEALKWFAAARKIPLALAEQTYKEYYPIESYQPYEVKGLNLALQQALEYKFIPHAMTPADLKGMIDILVTK